MQRSDTRQPFSMFTVRRQTFTPYSIQHHRIRNESDRCIPLQGGPVHEEGFKRSKPIGFYHEIYFEEKQQVVDFGIKLHSLYDQVRNDEIQLFGIPIISKETVHETDMYKRKTLFSYVQSGIKSFFGKASISQSEQQDQNQLANHVDNCQEIRAIKHNNNQLNQWQKIYLTVCYYFAKKQIVIPSWIPAKIDAIIDQSRNCELDEIRVVSTEVKFDKMNWSLVFRKRVDDTYLWAIEPKTQKLQNLTSNVFFRQEDSVNIDGGPTYTYDSTILQVQPWQDYISVRTQTSIYLSRQGHSKIYPMRAALMRWGHKGLYIFQAGGNITVLIHQRRSIKQDEERSLFEFRMQREYFGKWSNNDFLIPVDLEMIHGSLCEPGYLNLRVIGGSLVKAKLNFNQNTNILFVNGYSNNRRVTVFVIIGQRQQIETMYEYKFRYV